MKNCFIEISTFVEMDTQILTLFQNIPCFRKKNFVFRRYSFYIFNARNNSKL